MPNYEPVLLANIEKEQSHTLAVYEAGGGYGRKPVLGRWVVGCRHTVATVDANALPSCAVV